MQFPDCGREPLGIYPIVNRANKLRPLYEVGITTAQIRIKDLKGRALEQEIIEAIATSRAFGARLFINDYWEYAIAHNAYGVHLGQEDIWCADIDAIYRAGIRLGISTHTPKEIDIALAFKPSYVAIGPVFVPISKALKYDTVGIDLLRKWSSQLDCPVVAIGGITTENIDTVCLKEVDGIAMISAVLDENDKISKNKTRVLIEAFERYVK